ncbi:hypothetical protein DJ39_2166 [Yersinia ruckeri ATCC 29473]|uniref:Uncharacterized protein n=1 Tax=Yersinia ruckeri TaxID=29486 RepID=A0A380QT54_YERRU|nr:hypothetical protein QMA0440_00929 [Yersinia ruckeri]KGA51042.1 hypothetical protein DJ39_2166 [Yersinia ruckeri ATCC 29473]KFE37519.1 hypothetical protein nADLYRO1b_3136 [Yersinia ruckeri]CNB27964.1 Uncharacterised protein [Yersinia ruckeri]CNH77824.1 Uncharacterised protein [Yersinia ruckeri]
MLNSDPACFLHNNGQKVKRYSDSNFVSDGAK